MNANFLTGPVAVRPEVRAAFCTPPASHRGDHFRRMMRRTRDALTALTNAEHVTLMIGSGTLANDAVAAQIRSFATPGLILANGEFGERLVDHARRWGLRFDVGRRGWGRPFDWEMLRSRVLRTRPGWIWAVLNETSTGVLNPLAELLELSRCAGAGLCLDAVSAVGLVPVDLAGVRLASAVSGKGLAAYPGIAAVFHDGRLARSDDVPRYLDIAAYEAADGVPFTHSLNLLAALECSLALTDWPQKFGRVRRQSRSLRESLRRQGLTPLAREEDAAPGVITLPVAGGLRAGRLASGLQDQGIEIAWQSGYLRERNWLQVALMGEIDAAALHRLPVALADEVGRERGVDQRVAARCAMAKRDQSRSTSAR